MATYIPLQCYVCSKTFSGPIPARDHFTSVEHSRRMKASKQDIPGITCNVCSVTCNTMHDLEKHVQSPRHKANAEKQRKFHGQHRDNGDGIAPSKSLNCEICGVSLNGPESAQQHYTSEKHRKQVVLMEKRDRGEELPLECEICNCSFTGQESAEAHFKGKKHQMNMKNMNIQSKTKQTAANAGTFVDISKPPINMMQEYETIVQQNASQQLLTYKVPSKEVQTIVKTGGSSEESPAVHSTTHLFEHGKQNQKTPGDDIQKLQKINPKNLLTYDTKDSLCKQAIVSNTAELSADDGDELIVKPIANDDDNQIIRPFETENTGNVMHKDNDDNRKPVIPECNLQMNKRWTETEMFESLSEIKIKAETYSSISQQFGSLRLCTEDFSSIDTEPVRYVNNDLGQSLAPIGRGRSILTMFKQQEEKLSRKIHNACTEKLNNEYNNTADISDDSETWKKSAWPDMQSDELSKLKNNGDFEDEDNTYSSKSQPHFNDSSSNPTISSSPTDAFFDEDDVERETVNSRKFEEYVFDQTTGRGKCYICDIEFTSSKHKNQHILGKNHLKAREVHREMLKKGEAGCGPLICRICSVTFSGLEAKQQHMESEKHMRKEKRQLEGEENGYYCDICKIACTGPQSYTQHMMGAQHRRLAGESNADDYALSAPNYDRTKWYPCEICKCSMNTYEQLKIHERSPKHLKMLEKQVSGGMQSQDRTQWFPCNICNVSMNTYEQLKIHEQSPRHIKQLEKQTPGEVQNFDRTQWFPCKICNVNMNTLEQLKIHEQSPRHLKQLEKRIESESVSPHDRTIWYPCKVCNCNLNTQEQLRIHEASPAHIAKQRKFNDIQLMSPSIAPSVLSTDSSLSLDLATPLGSFLSQELFPEEFLPPSESTVNNRDTKSLEANFQEQLVTTDEPFIMAPRFALITPEQMERGSTNSQSAGGTKHGIGSDLAFATRSRGTRENNIRRGESSPHSNADHSNSQEVIRCQTSALHPGQALSPNQNQSANLKTSPTENNPYAATHRYYCHTCRSPMNNKESYENHLRGRRHMQKVCAEQAPQRCHLEPRKLPEDYLPYTKTKPRNYQQELHKKTMFDNTLCFLPTGTGKTLVSVMTMSAMLDKYPTKNVLFLVDKVLLVIQQSKYIKSELEEKEFYRFNPDSDNGLDIEKRKLRIAAMCMGQQTTNGIPLWKHDVVVVTAAFCQNLLDKHILKWEDFCLVVFDEAHHCEKGHPFNTLLATYHRRIPPENRPKVLGLTASPAGKIDVQKTLQMLRGLVSNMGNVRMTIVEEHENVDTLNEYQSNADMIIRPQLAPSDLMESSLKHELNSYIIHCLLKLYEVSDIRWYLDFKSIPSTKMSDDEVKQVADDFVEKNFDMIQSSLNMINNDTECDMGKTEFYHLRMHVQSVCMTLSCLEEGGVLIALGELEDLESSAYNLTFARQLGLPTSPLQQIVARQGAGLGGQDPNSSSDLHMQRLIDELTAGMFVGNDVRSISLVLVKQRATAHLITKVLQKSDRMRKLGLNTTCVVGHGGSGAADKGMNVNQQKRVLEEIKQHQYQVIVATSVAEEGVDLPECERVISLYPPSTVTALVQMRGRARRKDSKFIVLCSSQDEEAKLYDIIQREKNMIEATHLLLQETRTMENA